MMMPRKRHGSKRVAEMEQVDRPGAQPDFEEFSRCRGGQFVVSVAPGVVVELTLIEATAMPARSHAARPVPFSLVFLGPKGRGLSQGIHAFDHDELGPFEMFIVPIAPVEQGPRYEAIFN
jgi:hypothetical protein